MEKFPWMLLRDLFLENADRSIPALGRILPAGYPEIKEVRLLTSQLEPLPDVGRRRDFLLKVETVDSGRLLLIEPQDGATRMRIRFWANFISEMEATHDLRTELVVFTADELTAQWARDSLVLGPESRPSMRLFPHVCGPDNMPLITDPAAVSEDPVFAVLAFLCRRKDRDSDRALRAVAGVLNMLGTETAYVLGEYLRGLTISRTRTILEFFELREMAVDEAQRERIGGADVVQLRDWVRRAPFVASVEELFAD